MVDGDESCLPQAKPEMLSLEDRDEMVNSLNDKATLLQSVDRQRSEHGSRGVESSTLAYLVLCWQKYAGGADRWICKMIAGLH